MTTPAYYISRDRHITLWLDGGQTKTVVRPDHLSYKEIKNALVKKMSEEEIVEILETSEALEEEFVEEAPEEVTMSSDGQILYSGKPLHNVVTQRIKELRKDGYPYAPLVAFLGRLMLNPSQRAISELFDFLENRSLPLTEDGCFLAYKAVRSDFLDKYSGTIDNSPGTVVEIDRAEVDSNRERECSYGLHVGAMEYVEWYGKTGDKVVLVKVNPEDCVSVPLDHKAQKLRCCKYEVLREIQRGEELEAAAYSSDGESWDVPLREELRWTEVEIRKGVEEMSSSDLLSMTEEMEMYLGDDLVIDLDPLDIDKTALVNTAIDELGMLQSTDSQEFLYLVQEYF